MTIPLFEVADPDPGAERQECDRCPANATASIDGLRTRGWIAYDGESFTGKKLKVRVCPACRRGE